MKKSVQLYQFEVLKLLLKLVVILKPMIVMSVPVWFKCTHLEAYSFCDICFSAEDYHGEIN